MTSRKGVLLTFALYVALALPAQAEVPSGDQIAAGHKFAEMVCGVCHVVTQQRDELPYFAPPGPSFAVLAQRPALTEQSLREFLGSNHRNLGPAKAMPNPRLVGHQIDETVAYFMARKAAK
jgi:mono/diheme cytochrome c family protein